MITFNVGQECMGRESCQICRDLAGKIVSNCKCHETVEKKKHEVLDNVGIMGGGDYKKKDYICEKCGRPLNPAGDCPVHKPAGYGAALKEIEGIAHIKRSMDVCTLGEFDWEKSQKHDSGKLRYDLIPPIALKALATVLTYGAKKYKADSWQGLEDFDARYMAALMRHIEAWRSGERYDSESGIHHLAHALCNLIFLLWRDVVKEKIPLRERQKPLFIWTDEGYFRWRGRLKD